MTKLEQKLRRTLPGLCAVTADGMLVAVSGGADSVALLDALVRLQAQTAQPTRLAVAHLNHQLRGVEAELDEQFVRELAAKLKLEAVIERSAVSIAAQGRNLEATARRLRYEFLQRAARACGADFVLTAHTQDDQAETVLMRLLRGSGAEGLRGIFPQMPLGDGVCLLRPLLQVTRAEVLAHCAHYGLEFRTDSSNFSRVLTRNRVRHELLPVLRTFNPRCNEALARTAELLAADERYWQAVVAQESSRVRDDSARLELAAVRELAPPVRRRLLRAWLREAQTSQLDWEHLAALEKLISTGQSGQGIDLPGDLRVVLEFGKLRCLRGKQTEAPAPVRLVTDEPVDFGDFQLFCQRKLLMSEAMRLHAQHPAGCAVLLRESSALDALWLRARQPGDAYVPWQKQRPVKLKTLLMRHKIARTARSAHPLLVTATGEIVWSPGLPVAAGFAPLAEAEFCALVTARKR